MVLYQRTACFAIAARRITDERLRQERRMQDATGRSPRPGRRGVRGRRQPQCGAFGTFQQLKPMRDGTPGRVGLGRAARCQLK